MEDLTIGRKIEKGTFGKVYKGKLRDETVAVKIIKKDFLDKHNINSMYEINILKNLYSPHTVKLVECLEDDVYIYHVLEYVETDLYKIIQRRDLNEEQSLSYVKNITRGLIYLNMNNIAHFDIKPENILVDRYNKTKITDFGHSAFFDIDTVFEKHVGTLFYMAPEVIRQFFDYRADIWSLGICYYEMINKYPPFYSENDNQVLYSIIHKDIKYNKNFSENCEENISKLLQKDPNKRINFSDILKL